ncbi:uncharacterized protein LOC131255646 [Magnolia sinica]|uniref:uncharacterized protein LOC131255646 n=1 Tax=Magnolia sinica TaxID=86752 RepID=UPI00265A01F7|nr:uncharacterized protein LOC131255646 [Magnolia sinica]
MKGFAGLHGHTNIPKRRRRSVKVPLDENTTPQSNLQSQQQQQQEPQQEQGDVTKEEIDSYESEPCLVNTFLDEDTAYNVAKYKKYEADYLLRLNAKYFSKKAMDGVSIFDVETTIEDEVIKSSRDPPTKSFIDPIRSAEDQSISSSSAAEASSNAPNRRYQSKKSG